MRPISARVKALTLHMGKKGLHLQDVVHYIPHNLAALAMRR